jgi:hypothetical protein
LIEDATECDPSGTIQQMKAKSGISKQLFSHLAIHGTFVSFQRRQYHANSSGLDAGIRDALGSPLMLLVNLFGTMKMFLTPKHHKGS